MVATSATDQRSDGMSTTEHDTTTGTDDAAAIEELHETVGLQRAAFLADPFPTLEERQGLLMALAPTSAYTRRSPPT
jgi:hypothetical protein